MFAIFISTVILTLDTLPYFQVALKWTIRLEKTTFLDVEIFKDGKSFQTRAMRWQIRQLAKSARYQLWKEILNFMSRKGLGWINLSTLSQPEGDGMGETYQPFVIIEAVYMGWFTLEFFVRFLSSPSKVKIIQLYRLNFFQLKTYCFRSSLYGSWWT